MNTTHELSARRWLLPAGVILALLAAACGTDDNTTPDGGAAGGGSSSGSGAQAACVSGTISGAGSTFVQTIVQQWIKDFGARCPGATVNYQGVGSGAGIQQFTAGTVDFAGSDVVMTPEEQAAAEARVGPVLHIPWSAGGIAVEFNLPGVSDLKLTPEALAGIFAGKITKWDDPAITSTNGGTHLPSTSIQVIHRSDGSGTTAAFTSYLAAAAPSVWTVGSGKDVAWPAGQGAKGSDGVTAAVKQTEGGIGYAELSFPKGASLGVAKIRNAAGNFVGPDAAAVSAALAEAQVPGDLKVVVTYTPQGATAYPISTPTFVLVPKRPADPTKAKLLTAFALYALGEGQQAADRLYYAPLPKSLVDRATTLTASIGS
jgi:phosphate transport system substrate-binding protein